MAIAKLRYIQSVRERAEYRNPDYLVGAFFTPAERWGVRFYGRKELAPLRAHPLYYFILARTQHYDSLFREAIDEDFSCIINVGCGSDTRAYRFAAALKRKGIKVVECDQREAIVEKQRLAEKRWRCGHVSYLAVDLSQDGAAIVSEWQAQNGCQKVFLFLEGVTAYIPEWRFDDFLKLLARKFPSGSRIAYDFKLRGVDDDYGRDGAGGPTFRLPAEKDAIRQYHEERGYRLLNLEMSRDLTARLLPGLAATQSVFAEDGFAEVEVK